MNIFEFLSHVRSLGIDISVAGERLRVKGPKTALSTELRVELTERKAAILEILRSSNAAARSSLPALVPVSRDSGLSLSFAQERLWFLDQLEPDSSFYNVPYSLHLEGPLGITALEQSLNEIVRRHESLRTTFKAVDGEPLQIVSPSLMLSLPVIDLGGIDEPKRECEARSLAEKEAREPFDLARDPLVRATLLRLGHEDHVLLVTTHHIVSDGWSTGVLFRELALLYDAFSRTQPSPLSELPVQYADFAQWQRSWLRQEVLETHLLYWQKQLADTPAMLELPTDRPRPAAQSYRGAQESIVLSKNMVAKLNALSRDNDVTLFMTLLAAFQTLLFRYSRQEDIVVGSPIANRNRTEIEGLIGFFVNTLVLRTDMSGNPTFKELLARVRKVALEAYEHQDLPFEKLVENLHPERNLSRTPLFQVTFALQNAPRQPLKLTGLTVSSIDIKNETAKFDLSVELWEEAQGIKGSFEYCTDLFDAVTINRLSRHFQLLLEAIVSTPERRISDLPMLSEEERHQLLVEWNDTKTDYPQDRCIHELFEEQVDKSPDAVAVTFEDRHLTYRELNTKANQLAHYLHKLGIGADDVIGICMDRSPDLIVGLLGVLKAGGAYLPLDPEYPKDRLEFMLEDTQATVLLTQAGLKDRLPKYAGKKLALDSEWDEVAPESGENPHHQVTANHLAYVIFTSGSTGKPKGVMIEHRGLTNYLNYCVTAYPIEAGRGSLVHSSIAFDATITGLFAPLLVGRAVYLLPNTDNLEMLAKMLRQLRDFSVVKITPAHLALLGHQIPPEEAKDLTHCFVVGGENLVSDQISFWQTNAPGTLLFNEYGPTENVVGCIVYEASQWRGSGSVPIGRAIPNTSVYVLDQYLQPVPIGVHGELYLGGAGVARGYLNRAELTAEKFIANPFSHDPRARLYRTGDVARYLPDGNIEFVGRIDHQVKIRGYRIDLGEIESVLCQHPAIRDAVVLARGESSEDKRLVGYLVSKQQPGPTITELRNFLQEKLPNYMVPSAFVCLDALPLTPNGKVNRKALPAPDGISSNSESVFIAPRDDVEYRLANIWESVLGTQPISIKDNFFDLGGHSLLAIKLFAEIEKITRRKLPLAVLFQAPTIEQLAGIVRIEVDATLYSSLVPIRPEGSKPPLFLVHGADGDVLNFADLARHMDADQPLYALRSPGIDGGKEPLAQIECMAAHYIAEIRELFPEGPYFLMGYCMGGTVAFEMSLQLLAKGQRVPLLILVESPRPVRTTFIRKFLERCQRDFNALVVERFAYHGRNLKKLSRRERLAYVLDKTYVARERLISRLSRDKSKTETYSVPAHRAEVMDANIRAVYRYEPKRYPGRITLFLTQDSALKPFKYHMLAWGELADSGAEVHTIPGNHTNMVWDPQVKGLATQLRDCIDKAISTNPN